MDTFHCPSLGSTVDTWYPFIHEVSKCPRKQFEQVNCPYSFVSQVWGVRLLWWSTWLSVGMHSSYWASLCVTDGSFILLDSVGWYVTSQPVNQFLTELTLLGWWASLALA
jgi:hypothetical protein